MTTIKDNQGNNPTDEKEVIMTCEQCDWTGDKRQFAFNLCPNHRIIAFNEDTNGCFICKKCYKWFLSTPESGEMNGWTCQECQSGDYSLGEPNSKGQSTEEQNNVGCW